MSFAAAAAVIGLACIRSIRSTLFSIDGELARVLGLGREAGLRRERRRSRRGQDAARVQPLPSQVLYLRRPQLPPPLRCRQRPQRDCDVAAGERSGCEFEKLLRADGSDASLSAWALGNSADAAGLQMQSIDGHVRCIRLLVADFIPSTPYEVTGSTIESAERAESKSSSPESSSRCTFDYSVLVRFINMPADGGVMALHMAALNGYSDCVHLLLDLHASVSAVTFQYGSAINLIGAGSTPLHFAACGGSLKCCQILLSRGASRLTLNCNGWLPVDVAKMWGRRSVEPILMPNSDAIVPVFLPSKYLSLPLMSILNIARECGLQSSSITDDGDVCAVCLERACNVAAEGCTHQLCVRCALYLCSTSNITSEMVGPPGSIPCPLCRNGIVSFTKLPTSPAKELKPNLALSFCNPCILPPRALAQPEAMACISEFQRNRVVAVSSEVVCPLSCTPFPSAAIPSCSCDDDPCPTAEPQGGSQSSAPYELEGKIDEQRLERTSCSGIFWNRRSCHREHQCNSEINV